MKPREIRFVGKNLYLITKVEKSGTVYGIRLYKGRREYPVAPWDKLYDYKDHEKIRKLIPYDEEVHVNISRGRNIRINTEQKIRRPEGRLRRRTFNRFLRQYKKRTFENLPYSFI